MRLQRKKRQAWRIVDAQSASVMRYVMPYYLRAIAASIRGEHDAEAWGEYERATLRAMVLLRLLGEANARREMRLPRVDGQERIEAPDLAAFASLEITGLMSGPFVDAINAFLRDVPDLADRLTLSIDTLGPQARAMRVMESREAPAAMRESIVRQVTARRSQGDVQTILTDDAIADAVLTASGKRVASNRMETEYRTALLGTFNEGQRAQRIDHADRIPLTELVEIQDLRTRGNPSGLYPDEGPHYQMHGFVAPTSDPVWNVITPPNGYNCRGTTRGIGWPEARRRGWADGDTLNLDALTRDMAKRRAKIDRGEYPDSGFRGPVRPQVVTGSM
jgi:hypothetical protein